MNMGRKKKSEPYNIPDQILNVINEHCGKGWMLFTYDDFNRFRLYCNFDDILAMKSLKSDIDTYLSAVAQLEHDATVQKLSSDNQSGDETPPQETNN